MKLSAPIFRLKRQAKLLSRQESIPLHEAQDRIARNEGFQRWSQLTAEHARSGPGKELLDQLESGDLVLLAGKPYQGKTLLAFQLIAEAVKAGRIGMCFSLAENESDIEHRFETLGLDPAAATEQFPYDTSDDISAPYVVDRCRELPSDAVVVIDYLQLLDQQRRKPVLADQVALLKAFAEESQTIVVLLSQIDRSFDRSDKVFPDLEDIRLPNPLDLSQFTKTCVIHDGEVKIGTPA